MKKIDEQYAMYMASEKKIGELYHRIAVKMGVSDSVMWIMYCLCEPGADHTQNSIAGRIGVPKQTINSAINRLLKDGYISLEQLPVSGNNKRIALTEKGKSFCKEQIAPFAEAEDRAFSKLSEEEQEQYLALGIKHNRYQIEEFTKLLDRGKYGGEEAGGRQ